MSSNPQLPCRRCDGRGALPLDAALRDIAPDAQRRTRCPVCRGLGVHFTDTELDVLHLLASGRTAPQVGEYLSITPSTVKFHTQALLQKIRHRTKTGAVVAAIRIGLIDLDAVPDPLPYEKTK